MRTMKFKKSRNDYEDMSIYEEIIFVDHYIWRERNPEHCGNCEVKGKFNDISYICIADSVLIEIFDDEWVEMSHDYEFVEFLD